LGLVEWELVHGAIFEGHYCHDGIGLRLLDFSLLDFFLKFLLFGDFLGLDCHGLLLLKVSDSSESGSLGAGLVVTLEELADVATKEQDIVLGGDLCTGELGSDGLEEGRGSFGIFGVALVFVDHDGG